MLYSVKLLTCFTQEGVPLPNKKQQEQKLVTARETKYGADEFNIVYRNTPRALQSALSTSDMSIMDFKSLKELTPIVQSLPKATQLLWRDITTTEGAMMFIHAQQTV